MSSNRILTVQDISCVGKCSLTIALPILSACGHETSILPTAVLSTHTGGFSKPAVCHLNAELGRIRDHWSRENIQFDIILTGYLGSVEAVEEVLRISDTLLAPGGELIVDPAMADHGRLYSGLDEEYAAAMKKLCIEADILLPNVTEAAMLSGIPYGPVNEEYVCRLLEGLPCRKAVLTGIGRNPGETGAEILDEGIRGSYRHRRFPQNYHGTGDVFAACFTGARAEGLDLFTCTKIAADFTAMAIENTAATEDSRFGVRFEPCLCKLPEMLTEYK